MLGPDKNSSSGYRECAGGNQTAIRTVYSQWSGHIIVIKSWFAHVIQLPEVVVRVERYKLYRSTLLVGGWPEQWRFSEDLTTRGSLYVISGEPRLLIPQVENLGESRISWGSMKLHIGGCCKARSEVPTSAGFPAPHSHTWVKATTEIQGTYPWENHVGLINKKCRCRLEEKSKRHHHCITFECWGALYITH